jgi:hypothetical protein
MVSGPVFRFCAPVLVFGGTEGVGSRFHVLQSRTCFGRYLGRRVPFSCFVLPDSFSALPRASGPVFMFCTSGLVFGVTEGVGPVFVFCAPGLIFGDSEGAVSRFHLLRSGTCFWRYRGRQFRFLFLCCRAHFRRYRGRLVPFSCFALPFSFSAVLRVLGLVFMFCASVFVFGGTEDVGSRFHVLRSWTRFVRYLGRRVPFSFLRFRTRFRVYRGRRVPFSCFARPN